MKKQGVYPPIQLLSEFGDSCLGIYEAYSENLEDDPDYPFDAALKTAQKYFQTYRQREECAERLLLLGGWRTNKQVYRFTREFYDLMQRTENFEVYADYFKHLPYQTFYLEFPNDIGIHGTFVRFLMDDVNIAMLSCAPADNGSHIMGVYNFKDGLSFQEVICDGRNTVEGNFSVKKFLLFVFQACMYLAAENSDIQENEKQKRIYKPARAIQDRFKEIRMWDVGFRENTVFKKALKRNACDEGSGSSAIDNRNRPRAHWRRAHWHTYWTGEGRRVRTLKFVLPTLVNAEEYQDRLEDMPVVSSSAL